MDTSASESNAAATRAAATAAHGLARLSNTVAIAPHTPELTPAAVDTLISEMTLEIEVGSAADISEIDGLVWGGRARSQWMLVEQNVPRGPGSESYAAECLINNPHCAAFVLKYETSIGSHRGGKRGCTRAEYVFARYKK